MKLIKQEKLNKEITEKYSYDFILTDDGIYLIEIIASAKSWWQNIKNLRAFFKDDDLTLILDEIEISSSISNKTDARAVWNGNKLKSLLKTVVIAIRLKQGKHTLSFISDQTPFLKNITISQLEEINKIIYIPTDNNPAENGDNRPWLSFILINLAIKNVAILAKVDKIGRDDDDIKLIINSEIQKNEDKKSHQDWYWCGKILQGEKKEFKKTVNFNGDLYTIDFWADEAPFLEKIEISLTEKNVEKNIKPYLYKGVNNQENYNRYDKSIKEAVDYWNREFLKEVDPPEEILDPNLVKAMIFQESRVGYDKNNNGEINVIQVGNYGDASLDVLNGRGKKMEYELKNSKLWKVNYEGKAKVEKPFDSIYWGVRWLYHKAQGITMDNKRYWLSWREAVKRYGPPNEKYSNNIWDIYTKGIDKKGKSLIRLWFIFIPLMLIFSLGAFWLYNNQGRVFISYHEATKNGQWLCDNESWVNVALLDGFKLKKTILNKVQVLKGDCAGLKKGSLKYSYTDLDNDGAYEIVLDGKWDNDYQVEYYLKIEKDKLAIIPVDGQNLFDGSESLVDEFVYLNWPDKQGKYTFVTEAIVGYLNAPNTIFRDIYHFNNKGEIELYHRETEELTGNVSKIGKITEIPL